MTSVMGLRRRVPVNPPAPSPPTSSKRSRSENNNNPSHGNLNSLHGRDEPAPAKKSRVSNSVKNSLSVGTETTPVSRGRGASKSRVKSPMSAPAPVAHTIPTNAAGPVHTEEMNGFNVLTTTPWSVASSMPDASVAYGTISGLVPGSQTSLCTSSLAMPTPIPYMATSMATFVGTATNLNKNSSVSYLDISNMTSGSLGSSTNPGISAAYGNCKNSMSDTKTSVTLPFTGVVPTSLPYSSNKTSQTSVDAKVSSPVKFQNDTMFNTYQPWVIKTYGDLAKTKTITIKKYARILRTLRGEEVNSAENSKFRFWVKSKGFHIGQPEGYDAKPADRIIGRHAVTSPGLDPPLYVPTQLPHNKTLSNSEGSAPPGRVYKKVAIVENFFDIIHAVHVDLEGRPGKHAGQKRTYRTITETYAFLPREAVTRFLLGCTECQRRPRTPSPTNLVAQSQNPTATPSIPSTPITPTNPATVTPLSPTPATALSASPIQSSLRPREASNPPESKSLFNYRHTKHQRSTVTVIERVDKDKEPDQKDNEKREIEKKEEKYNPLSITNLLKKEPPHFNNGDNLGESRRTPESDRASSGSSVSSKRRRMLPKGRTPSPPPTTPLARPWSPGLDPKETPVDYSLPITTTYLKHQQRIEAEKSRVVAATAAAAAAAVAAAAAADARQRELEEEARRSPVVEQDVERERFSPAAGLIDTNLNLLATIQQLHCQVMLALTERLRPSVLPAPLILPSTTGVLPSVLIGSDISISTGLAHNHS